MSDDGEPKGTAGRPALEVLKGSGVTDCVLTIVRYFGGTKLGTGGLVHAYGDAAKGCFAALPTKEKRDLIPISVIIPYSLHEAVRSILVENGVDLNPETFTEVVAITGWADRERVSAIQERVRDVSRGTIGIVCDDEPT
jgi:putative IMPACT (imprinted ancient) family translation regulator